MIFRNTCKCAEVVFGIEVKEVDPFCHSYVLVKTVDLTSDWGLSDHQSTPNTSLLIFVLGMIFMETDFTLEKIWEILRKIGVYGDKKGFIYGNPKSSFPDNWCRNGTWSTGRCPPVIHYTMSSCGMREPMLTPSRWNSWSFSPS